jgi:hypothetical protein
MRAKMKRPVAIAALALMIPVLDPSALNRVGLHVGSTSR